MTAGAHTYEFLTPPATMSRGNVTIEVTELLRRAIVTLALPPGEIIDKNAICARLGISRFPVSEALSRLSAEGLVEILPQRGSRVSRIKMAEVREFMFIRTALECEALHLLVGSHSADSLELLEQNMAAQKTAMANDASTEFHELDVKFHELLFGAVHLSRTKAIVEQVRANIDRARRLIVTPRRIALTIAEHEAIFEAVSRADAPGAAEAMRAHIEAVMVELFAFAEQSPDLFADGETTFPAPFNAAMKAG